MSSVVFWFTGLPCAGKTTIGRALTAKFQEGYQIDGDEVRNGLCAGLGFSDEDRAENQRRIAWLARYMADARKIVVVTTISPKQEYRDRAGCIVGLNHAFIVVYVASDKDWCRAHDIKGMWTKATSGRMPNFTGVGADYEPPDPRENAVFVAPGIDGTPEQCASKILAEYMYRSGLLK